MTDTKPTIDDPLSSLPIPPLSPFIISDDDYTLPDDFLNFDFDDLSFTFDDQNHPSAYNQSNNNPFHLSSFPDPQFINNFVPRHQTVAATSPNSSGNQGLDASGFVNIDVQSPDDSGRGFVEESVKPVRIFDDSLSELRKYDPVSSQGSGNSGFGGLEAAVVCTSSDSGNSVVNNVERKYVLKRKNESLDVNSESKTVKQQRSNEGSTTTEYNLNEVNEEDEKRKARLVRNRESAQLSRQRKKQYVEELEDKVRAMQATIHDLNARISYIAAENAALKQQMVASAGSGAGVGSPPVMYPPYPGMAPMGYPWMPYPPYVVKSQGSDVPLVPIPRLKTQQTAASLKSKTDVKKTGGASKIKSKTKKVASISFIGLLLFIVLFGGLVPIMNVKFGGVRVTDGGFPVKLNDYKLYNQQHRGRVLVGDEHVNGTSRNASEPLVASLYVPRNNKLVKIDGNLIISSVLASEKAIAEQETAKKQETALDLVPAIAIPTVKGNGGRQPHMYRTSSDHQRALPSNEEAKHADGKLQQWFREGLSGLMLSSGMCTEVFQFDTSALGASGALVPATSVANFTATKNNHNSTYITTVKNRRILHSLPIPLSNSTTNITKEQVAGHDSKHGDRLKNKPGSSMVVSVLVDPREAGDNSDLDGMMGGGSGKGNSFSRIFVVVLLDSVKYVTYSCMLPLKGPSHLVTA